MQVNSAIINILDQAIDQGVFLILEGENLRLKVAKIVQYGLSFLLLNRNKI